MSERNCGCATESCGCCAGIEILTPASRENRPGLDTLTYRVGTYGSFFETMKARLAGITIEARGADGQTIESFQPLGGLTTRDSGDPAVALLDSWASVGDVLTFYQERIANEGYLRTATERRSVLELARLVGYTLRPGVASTVFLAYTLEDQQILPVEIPAGSRAQSIPGPGELPQSFETSEALLARAQWNNLQVRLQRPQNITLKNALTVATIHVAGTNLNLKTGDSLLLKFGDESTAAVLRTIVSADGQFENDRTVIQLQPLPWEITSALPYLITLIDSLGQLVQELEESESGSAARAKKAAETFRDQTYLGLLTPPSLWITAIRRSADVPGPNSPVGKLIDAFEKALKDLSSDKPPPATNVTDTSTFVKKLLEEPNPQAASGLELRRSLEAAFQPGADVHPRLLVNFVPRLQDSFYAAWSNAEVNATPPALSAIHVFRVQAPLFGATVQKQPTYFADDSDSEPPHFRGQLKPQSEWQEWELETEHDNGLSLDQSYEAILPESYVLIDTRTALVASRQVRRVSAAQTTPRTAYGISAKCTQLTVDEAWWNTEKETDISRTLRGTLVYGQSEKLTLAEEPMTPEYVSGQEIALQDLYNELTAGRWVIFSGERADIEGVSGVKTSELLMISSVRQDYDPKLPGDKTHTTLVLATPTAYAYKRATLTIYGNVVKATHGETRNETLGSGDGSRALQSFTLKQPPLTFVAAPTPTGVDSTLKIYVNDVEWHETATLAGLGAKDRNFIIKTDDEDKTTAIFGNGVEGARLPTGVENVKAVYRNGIGKSGNVLAEQISLLQSRPLGVKGVINPLRASGGADKERRDQARENAPLAVMALDRLVSLQDYADFTRTFAGISKAAARRLSDGRRELVHVTIAGADDIPIDPVSDLYRNLVIALRELGAVDLPVQVDLRELLVLVLSANVRLQPDYQWDPVAQAIQSRLLERFGFDKRVLGQPGLLCEIIAEIQNTDGVAYVDVDAFGGIPEKIADADGTRRLLTLDELALAAKMVVYGAYRYLLFEAGDFKDLQGLVKKLTVAERGPISDFLWSKFSSGTRKLLSDGAAEPSTRRALIAELNKVLLGVSIYNAERFPEGALGTEILDTLMQTAQGGDLIRLNRLLLESAYPAEIARSELKIQKPPSVGPPQRVDANLADFENGALRPAQLATFMPAVPETIVLNQIK